MLTRIISSFEKKNRQTQYNVLGFRTDLYFHDYKFAVKIDENRHSNRSFDYEIKREKAIEQELCCQFIRIDPDKDDFEFLQLSMKYLDTKYFKQFTKKP